MRNRQKEKSEATKKKLLQCAEKLFFEKGFEKTAVREIVAAAGVAQGTFYLYFETKEEVLYKILGQVLDTFNQYVGMLDMENPKMEHIDSLIDGFVMYMEQNANTFRLIHSVNFMELVKMDTFIPEKFVLSELEKWLENAGNTGLISHKPPKLYARILFQIAHELLESAFLYHYPEKIAIVKEEVKQILRKVLS